MDKKVPGISVSTPPKINADEFVKVVESRRSVRRFTDDPVPAEVVNKCLDLAMLAPNSCNLQPWEFYWIKAAKSANGVVDCKGGGKSKGTPLHFWSKHGGDSQKFYLKKLPNGSYKIYSKSGKVVCLQNNKTDNNYSNEDQI